MIWFKIAVICGLVVIIIHIIYGKELVKHYKTAKERMLNDKI